MARRQHRLGQAPRRLPDPQHARAAGRFSVAGQRQGALGSPRYAGPPDRAVDGDRAPLQGRADDRGLRPAQRAGGDARREPVARSGRPHRRRHPHRRRRAHAVRGTSELGRRRLVGGRGARLLPHPRSEHRLRVPLLQAVSLHAPERVVGAVRGRERPLPRHARRGRVVPARSQGGHRGEPEASPRATARGRSIRARRSRSTIRRSSSASRCWSSNRRAQAKSGSTI